MRRRASRRQGSDLLSTLVSLGLLAAALALVLQAYVQGRQMTAHQARRVQAAAACQEQLELARVAGYARLATGARSFAAATNPALRGQLSVRPEAAGAKRVTARVTWPAQERGPAGQIELATIVTARGLNP